MPTLAALAGFVVATVLVLVMYLPSQVVASDVSDASGLVDDHWEDEGWDQRVASFLVAYVGSLRVANEKLLPLLYAAIIAEVVGIAGTAAMAVSLLFQAL